MDRTTLYAHLLVQTGFLTSATGPAIDKEVSCMRKSPVSADVPAIGAIRDDCRLDSIAHTNRHREPGSVCAMSNPQRATRSMRHAPHPDELAEVRHDV